MKKLIVIGLLFYGAYHYFPSMFSSDIASFDEAGNPVTLLFTLDKCPPCDDARNYLIKRKIKFQEYNIFKDGDEARDKLRRYGGGWEFPYLVSGDQVAPVFDKYSYSGMFAKVFGDDFLLPYERMLFKKNFDAAGQPKLVMYSTKTCGYCTSARKFLDDEGIPYTELFIDENATAKKHFDLLRGSGTPLIYIGYQKV